MQVLVPPEVRSRQAARFKPGPAAPAASTAPKLRDRLREQIRLEGKSPNTAAVYWHWAKGYIRFHGLQHPQDLGVDDVRRYLNHLVNDRQVSKNTHGQALHALLYLYRRVLGLQLPWLDDLHAPKPSQRLPVVLNEAEVRRLWPHLQGTPGLICKLMYGTGLRIMEALRLRVHDIDLEDAKITVRGGKGDKDRVTMVPQALLPALREQLAHRTAQHVDDLLELRWAPDPDDPDAPHVAADGLHFRPGKTRRSTRAAVVIGWTPRLQAAIDGLRKLQAARLLKRRAEQRVVSGYVFTTQGGLQTTYSGIASAWKRAKARAGVADAHIHDIRAKALTDKERSEGLQAARTMGTHSTEGQTADYLRSRSAKRTGATR